MYFRYRYVCLFDYQMYPICVVHSIGHFDMHVVKMIKIVGCVAHSVGHFGKEDINGHFSLYVVGIKIDLGVLQGYIVWSVVLFNLL